jgi:hypothetical protein
VEYLKERSEVVRLILQIEAECEAAHQDVNAWSQTAVRKFLRTRRANIRACGERLVTLIGLEGAMPIIEAAMKAVSEAQKASARAARSPSRMACSTRRGATQSPTR